MHRPRQNPYSPTTNVKFCVIFLIYNILIHCISAILQSDWLSYSPYISSYIERALENIQRGVMAKTILVRIVSAAKFVINYVSRAMCESA